MIMAVLFGPVGPEVLVIISILILLFGANRIPKLANAIGKSFGSAKKGRQDVEQEIQEMNEEKEAEKEKAKN